MLNSQLSGINKMCVATFAFCVLALSTNAQGLASQQNEEVQLLLELILKDDAHKVESYLSSKPIPQYSNISLFKTAISRGKKRIVEAFFKAGANKSEAGLICAALSNVSMTELLIAHGVNIHGKECNGMSPLQAAVKGGYQDTVKIMLQNGADTADKGGEINTSSTSLREAAMAGNESITKILLERGDTLNSNVISEVTQRNCMSGNLEVLKLLKDHNIAPDYDVCYASLAVTTKFSSNLLTWLQSQKGITKFVIGGQPLINNAAERGNLVMAKYLIDSGARLDQRDAQYNYSALGAALSPESVSRPLRLEMAELLLKGGADPNQLSGRGGMTLLEELTKSQGCIEDEKSYHLAGESIFKAAELLIKYGAKVTLANPVTGNTALHNAAVSRSPELVQLLLNHGADVSAANVQGYPPLYSMAAASGRCGSANRQAMTVELLVRHGARMDIVVNGKKLEGLVDRKRRGSDSFLAVLERLNLPKH